VTQVVEIRELRDFAELEKQRELEELRSQLLEEKANEIQALQARLEANKVKIKYLLMTVMFQLATCTSV
jgi:hypothetical protein